VYDLQGFGCFKPDNEQRMQPLDKANASIKLQGEHYER